MKRKKITRQQVKEQFKLLAVIRDENSNHNSGSARQTFFSSQHYILTSDTPQWRGLSQLTIVEDHEKKIDFKKMKIAV